MAFVNNYNLIVDIKKRLASPVPMFRQDDTARLTFKIYDDGVLFDLTGYSRSDVTFQLPSGESLVGNAELVGDKIVYNFVGIELVEEGEVKVTLSIYSGSTVVSVQPFVIFVYKRFNSDQASYIGILQELIVNVTQLEIDVRQAISEVNVIKVKYDEDYTKLSDALVKVDKAVSDEIIRTDNENQRISNENQRIVNEMNREVKFSSYQEYIEKLEAVGEFTLGNQYYKNNIVRDNLGNSYMAKRDNVNVSLTSTDDWMILTKRGEKGDTGAGLNIKGVLTDESQLPPSGISGDAYTVNGFLYVWSEDSSQWINVGYIKGEKGDKGDQGERGEKGDISEITEYSYVIPATMEGQTLVQVPLSTLSNKDSIFLTLNGTTLYNGQDFTVSGSVITLTQPIVDYQNTTMFVRVLKTVPKGTQIPTSDGSLLTDGSVTKQKLETTLQQDIDRIATTEKLGRIKPDGVTLTVDPLTGVASVQSTHIKDYSSGHLDNLIESGLYRSDGGSIIRGFPRDVEAIHKTLIEVFKTDDGWVLQRFTWWDNSTVNIYERGMYLNTWGVWYTLPSGLDDTLNSASTIRASTANAVKQLNDKIDPAPVLLTPRTPFTYDSINNFKVVKVGKIGMVTMKIKNSQQLVTTSQYQLGDILPVGYRNTSTATVGHVYCIVSSQLRYIPVTINNGLMILQNPPITIPIDTNIEGTISFYVD